MKLFISILLFSMFTLSAFAQKGVTNYWEIEVDTSEKKINYKKEYNFNLKKGYSKKIIRNYYGLQSNMLHAFQKNEPNKDFSIEQFYKFPIASFFNIGAFDIPNEHVEVAKKYFEPVLDSIFSSNTNDTFLHAEILVIGYTDIQSYQNIKSSFADVGSTMHQPQLSVSDYQNNISYLRAVEIGELLQELVMKNNFEFHRFNKVIFDIKMIGKGTEFPEQNRKYENEDSKRRIAKIYWRVIN